MIGTLSPQEIENLLLKQSTGRLGCHNTEEVYVVPISYAYDGENIYCHTYEGKKLKMMRAYPDVCFEVDEMEDMANWKSVIIRGRFEELHDKEQRNNALKILLSRRLPILSSTTTHLGKTWPFTGDEHNGINDIPGIVFKISIKEKTGKFEKVSLPYHV